MLDVHKKKLLFITSPLHDLKAIESFLKKRNYEVTIESDIKLGLIKVIETQAEFVFIALDHTDPQIFTVPGILAQSSQAVVICYVQNNSKESIRKLDYSGFPHKLYPPISGPPIERLVLKIFKELISLFPEESRQKQSSAGRSQDEINQIKTKLLEDFERDQNGKINLPPSESSVVIQKGQRGTLLKSTNEELQSFTKNSLSQERKNQLKQGFQDQVKIHLEDMIETYKDFSNDNVSKMLKKNPLESTTSKTVLSTSDQTEEFPKSSSGGGSSSLTSEQAFTERRRLQMEKRRLQADQNADSSVQSLIDHKTRARGIFCLTVQSSSWCGYLVIDSELKIDFSTSQNLFKVWLSENLENLTDLEDTEQFEIEVTHPNFKSWAKENADYSESVGEENNEILLSFFSIDPRSLVVEMNESELIEMPLRIIPVDRPLHLSIYLHLPENKKYLLYTRNRQILSSSQRKRLTDKNIDKLYTPQEFEKEYRKLIAETHLNELIDNIKSDSTT